MRSALIGFLTMLGTLGCDPARVCTPGASVACVGAGGCVGGQRCLADGSGFEACVCGGTDAGTDGGSSDTPPTDDTPGDVPTTDARGACDPIANTGCVPGTERCAWFHDGSGGGEARCVPQGTAAVGAACTTPSTGTDECVGGAGCVESVCRETCDTSAPCEAGFSCVHFEGVFDAPDDGYCLPRCNPVTQLLPDGSDCGAGNGCFAQFSDTGVTFACVPALFTRTHGEVITGTAFANACAPGHTPVFDPTSGQNRCAALCLPITTSAASPAGAGGMSPFACSDRGAAGTECLHAWLLSISTGPPDPLLDTFGYCFDGTGRTMDDDGDGMIDDPWTSCTVRSAVDGPDPDTVPEHRETGCAPYY